MSDLEQNEKLAGESRSRFTQTKMTKVDKVALSFADSEQIGGSQTANHFSAGLLKTLKTVWSHQDFELDSSGNGCEWFPSTWLDFRVHSG